MPGKKMRLAALGMGLALALGCLASSSTSSWQLAAKDQADWKRRSVPGAKISVELPIEPQRTAVELTEQTRKQVAGVQASRVQVGGVIFRFSYLEYPDGTNVDLDRAASGAISNLTSSTNVTEVKFKRTELKVSGVPGIRLETSYQYQGKLASYWIVIVGEGKRLWQSSAMFRTLDRDQESMVRRVLDSVRLEK